VFPHVRVKVCGLAREADVDAALEAGADYFGFIVYPSSPRAVSMERARELAARVPPGRRVLVDVETGTDDLAERVGGPFDWFQMHANLEVGLATLAAWSGLVGRERLWIAPRLPPRETFPQAVLSFADTVMVDAYSPERFGGTGETSDWDRFADLKTLHPKHRWILAGGLGPANVADAVAATGADAVDLNSGLEQEPGVKDPAKLAAAFRALRPGGANG